MAKHALVHSYKERCTVCGNVRCRMTTEAMPTFDKAAMYRKLLALDLTNLTQEEIDWLHEFKNLATTMTGRLQLKDLKAKEQKNQPPA